LVEEVEELFQSIEEAKMPNYLREG